MGFNRFFISILIRVVLISITVLFFGYFYFQDEKVFTCILFGILALLQAVLLFFYVNRVNLDLARFLSYIKEGDLTTSYPERIEKTFRGLKESFQKINEDFMAANRAKEERQNYLEVIIKNNKTGLISFNEKERIEIANDAALKLLEMDSLNNIKELDDIKSGFYSFVKTLEPGIAKPYKLLCGGILKILLIQSTIIKTGDESVNVLSFTDIKPELDEKEVDSYKKLLRIIAHEIMNSLTPITTLTRTISDNLDDIKTKDAKDNQENIEDIKVSVDLINERALGLSDFVTRYRSLAQLPQPQVRILMLKDLFQDVEKLLSEELKKNNISINIELSDEDLSIQADEAMIKQVLINLVKNAVEACREIADPRIIVGVETSEGLNPTIYVNDNGKGISEEDQEKIFLPFYTTKELGSGIGLNISQQIIHLHGGRMFVRSDMGTESTFYFTI